MKDLISVVVPIYNVDRYLSKCIESILSQTYTNLEIILVDDGSTDTSGDICDCYAQKDSRIIVVHKENGGVSTARDAGLKIFSGDFLMYVDSDDYISEDAIQVMYEHIISDDSDMVIAKHIDVYEDGSSNGSFCDWENDAVLSKEEFLFKQGEKKYYPVANAAKLYRRKVLEGIHYPSFVCGEDVWAFPLIVDKCERISIVDKVVYFYYQRSNSIVHEKSEQAKTDDLIAVLQLSRYFLQNNIISSAKKWYGVGIDKAILLKKKRTGVKFFKEYFSHSERVYLLRGTELKIRIKWLSLHLPFVFNIIRVLKRLTGRKFK